MKNQWTTVTDNKKSPQDKRDTSSTDQPESARNRKIALALASVGVFLILIGAAPFLFSGNDSKNYSAFLGLNTSDSSQNEEIYMPVVENANFADGDELIAEPVEINVPEVTADGEEGTEIDIDPIQPEVTHPIAEETQPVETVVQPTIPKTVASDEPQTPNPTKKIADIEFTDPEVILDTEEEIVQTPGTEVITEINDFPINTHTGETVDPIQLARLATAEQLHSAAEESPGTGLPLLPVLAFSGFAAFFARKRFQK